MTIARRRKTLKVIHPIWSHCATLTDDPFWKEIYTQGSYGKMPKYFVYSNGMLGYSKGVKKYRSVWVPQELTEAFGTSITFFRENGLLSERDALMIQSQVEDDEIPDGYMHIDQLQKNRKKKKLFIELVLREFSHKYCKDNNILVSTNDLFNILFHAYKNKCLNDILVSDRHVIGLVGLSHDASGKIYYQNFNQPKITKVKYISAIEVIDPLFAIRSKSGIDMGKSWIHWLNTVNHELGRKEMLQQCVDNSTGISETD